MSIYRKNFPERMTRNASLEDAAAVAAIYNKCVLESTATFETEPLSDEQMRARMAEIIGRGFPYIAGKSAGSSRGLPAPTFGGSAPLTEEPSKQRCTWRKNSADREWVRSCSASLSKGAKNFRTPTRSSLHNLRKPPERAPPRKIRVPASFGFSGGGLQIRQIPRGIRLRAVDSARIRPIKKC